MASGFFLVLTIEIFVMDHQKRGAKKEHRRYSTKDTSQTDTSYEKTSNIDIQKEINLVERQCSDNGRVASENVQSNVTNCLETGQSDIHGMTHQHTDHDHHASRSLVLIVALSLHRIFEGRSFTCANMENVNSPLYYCGLCL